MARVKKLPSGNYRVQVYLGKDENGKRQYKSFTAVKAWEAEQQADEFLHRKKTATPLDITVKEAVEEYIEAKRNILAPTTIREYESTAEHRLGEIANTSLACLDTKQLQKHINTLAARLSPKTVSNTYGVISSAIKLLHPSCTLTLPCLLRNGYSVSCHSPRRS